MRLFQKIKHTFINIGKIHLKIKTFDGLEIDDCHNKQVNDHNLKNIFSINNQCIPMGSKMSYSSLSFGSKITSLKYKSKNKIRLSKDKKRVTVSSDIKLFELFNYLYKFDLYLKIQPGISSATVGGCIASNIHGKNQFRDGNFENIVESILLINHENKKIKITRNTNKQLFFQTIGGFGLTGLILEAVLKIDQLKSDYLTKNLKKIDSLYHLKKEYNKAVNFDYIYSWHIPCVNSSKFGKGFLFYGNFTNEKIKAKKNITLDQTNFFFNPTPFNFYNYIFTYLLNFTFYFLTLFSNKLIKKNIVRLDKLFFPFSSNKFYFYLFSKDGFYEYQSIISIKHYDSFISDMTNFARQNNVVITLISSKFFKENNPKYLNFDGTGICLAIDLPKNNKSLNFMKFLDRLNIKYKCIPNLVKDSRIKKNIVKKLYGKNYYFYNHLYKKNSKYFNSDFLKTILS